MGEGEKHGGQEQRHVGNSAAKRSEAANVAMWRTEDGKNHKRREN